MRDTSTEGRPILSVSMSRSVFKLKRFSKIHFNLKDVIRLLLQDNYRFHSIEVLVDNVGAVAVPFLKNLENCNFLKIFVPASIRVGDDLLEFAVPKNEDVVGGGKNFMKAAKSVGKLTLRKNLGSGSCKRNESRIFPTKAAKKAVDRHETFLQTFLIDHVE